MATALVAIVLVAAGYALVSLQRRSLTDGIETTIRLRADDIGALLLGGARPESLTAGDTRVALVQILDQGGGIVAASANIAGSAPVVETRPPAGHTVVERTGGLGIDDEPFLVLSRSVTTPGGPYTILVAGSLEEVGESAEALTTLLQIGIPILLVVVAWGTWLVVGRALSPVEDIRREVAEITENEMARRVPEPAAADEIGRLARTMNGMLDRLQSGHDRQQRFVADASHELRSPLASLRTQLEVELAGPVEPGGRSTLEGLLEEVLRMQRLVDDLLLVAQSDAGRLAGRDALVDLDDIVLAEARRVRSTSAIIVDTAAVSAAQVRGDAGQLARATRNLFENAARHARSRVVVTLKEAGGAARLSVADDGPGVPDEARERIFERFTRLDAGRARDHGGTGLGLAITRAIVTAHGGTIVVDPAHGEGARFVVTLPSWDAVTDC